MAKRKSISLSDIVEQDVRKDSVKLSFLFDIECTRCSADAMRHYMKVAERCYSQGRGVYKVEMKEISEV